MKHTCLRGVTAVHRSKPSLTQFKTGQATKVSSSNKEGSVKKLNQPRKKAQQYIAVVRASQALASSLNQKQELL